jgi:hypothetical protein
LRHGTLNLVASLIDLVAFQSGPVNGKRMDGLELRIAPRETQALERAHVKLKVVPVVLTATSVCIGAERHWERVVHAAQQFHDFFDVAVDGAGVYCVARRRHLDAERGTLACAASTDSQGLSPVFSGKFNATVSLPMMIVVAFVR